MSRGQDVSDAGGTLGLPLREEVKRDSVGTAKGLTLGTRGIEKKRLQLPAIKQGQIHGVLQLGGNTTPR